MLQDFGDAHKDSESDSIDIRFNTNDLPDGDTKIFVRICDCDGNCTDSDVFNYKIDNTISKPDTVGITLSEYATGGFQVEWEKSTSEDFLQYDLVHSLNMDMTNSLVVYSTFSVDENTFLFTNNDQLERFSTNYFYVTVIDTFNYSANSDTASAILLPDTIKIVSKDYSNNGFQIKWNKSSSTDFLRYDLYHSFNENMTNETLAQTSNSIEDTMFTYINQEQENVYIFNYFYVKVTDTFSHVIQSETDSTILVYEAVVLDSIEASGVDLTIKWSESEDINFASYNLYVSSDSDMNNKTTVFSSPDKSTTTFIDYDNNYGENYSFQVGTVNVWGLEALSNVMSILPRRITFSNNYDYSLTNDIGYFGIQNNEDRYMILGSNSENLILLLDDETGLNTELITLGYGPDETGVELNMMNDNEFLILSNVVNDGSDHDIRLTKTNSNGELSWNTVYGSDGLDSARDIHFTADNGILITGTFDPEPGRNRRELWLLKTNSNGTEELNTSIGYTDQYSQGNALYEVEDGYVVLGNTEEKNDPKHRKIWLVKFDNSDLENIDTSWTNVIDIENYDYPSDLIVSNDGSLVSVGYSTSSSDGESQKAWVLTTNLDGSNENIVLFPGNIYFYSIIQSSEDNFVIAGKKEVNSNMQAFVLCLDAFGAIIWQNTFGSEDEDSFMSVSQTNDGGYLLSGTSKVGSGNSDIFYVKTDSEGNVN